MGMGMGGMGGRGGGAPVPSQDAAAVSAAWPAGTVGVRLFPNLLQAQQKWAITPVANAGGSADAPYYKICVAGTERTLTATKDMELEAQPSFTGAAEQLWKIEKLADGTYRISPKSQDQLAISAIGYAMPTLSKFNPEGEKQRWLLRKAM
jgi:arabinan endo-1,5-alpha-L-arabinosidase